MSSETSTPTPADFVKEKFKTLAEAITEESRADQEKLRSAVEESFETHASELKTAIEEYIKGQPGEKPLTDLEIAAALSQVCKNSEGQIDTDVLTYLLKELGLKDDFMTTHTSESIFDRDDFSDSEEVPAGAADTTEETGTETEPTSAETIEKAKENFFRGIESLAEAWEEAQKDGQMPTRAQLEGTRTMMRNSIRTFLEENDFAGIEEADIVQAILEHSKDNKEKALFVLDSLANFVDMHLNIEEGKLEVNVDVMGNGESVFDENDLIYNGNFITAESQEKTKEGEIHSTPAQKLFIAFPEFSDMSSADITTNLNSMLDRILRDETFKEKYDQLYLTQKAKQAGSHLWETAKEGASGNTGNFTEDMGKITSVFWAEAGTVNKDMAQALADSLGLSPHDFFDTSEGKEPGYKVREKIKELMASVPENSERGKILEGRMTLADGVENLSVEDLLGRKSSQAEDGESTKGPYFFKDEIKDLVTPTTLQTLKNYINTIDTVYRGTQFGDAYMEYLAKAVVEERMAKPFHEWISEDSTITPIQRAFYGLKGLFKSVLGMFGDVGINDLDIPFVSKFMKDVDKYDGDENNPHAIGLTEAAQEQKDQETQLAEWSKTENKKLKDEYLAFAARVGTNVKDDIVTATPVEGGEGYTNESEALSKGMTVKEFSDMKTKSIREGVEEFTLDSFLTQLHEVNKDQTPTLLGIKTLADWTTFANLKDGEGETAQHIFPEDISKITVDHLRKANGLDEKKEAEEQEKGGEAKVKMFRDILGDFLASDINGEDLDPLLFHEQYGTPRYFFTKLAKDLSSKWGNYKLTTEDLNNCSVLFGSQGILPEGKDLWHKTSDDYWVGKKDSNKLAHFDGGWWTSREFGDDIPYPGTGKDVITLQASGGDIHFVDVESMFTWLHHFKSEGGYGAGDLLKWRSG